jgi:hypothetical protein
VADHTRLVLNTPCWGVSMTALLVIIAIFIALVLWSPRLQEFIGLLMLIGLLQFSSGREHQSSQVEL